MNELTHAHHLQQQQQSRAGVPPLPMAASTADRSKPQRFPRASEPNYANEYPPGGGFMGYGGGSHQQQQHLQQQNKDRELKFNDFQSSAYHQQQQQQTAPAAAAPQQYSYPYAGYGQYEYQQQQQQQQAMGHIGLAHHQHQHQQHQGYGAPAAAADPLGMLVSSATQPDAMPQQQQHDLSKNNAAALNKYRSFATQDTYLNPQALFSGNPHNDRQQQQQQQQQQDSFLPLKYAQPNNNAVQQQQQQQMALDVSNPHHHHPTSFRSQGSASSFSAGSTYYGSSTRGGPTSMELVSPTAAAAAMTSSYDASTGALQQRMSHSSSSNTSNHSNNYGIGLRVPHLLPGSAAALTNRLKDAGDLDPRIPTSTSLGFDPQVVGVGGVSSKAIGSSHPPMYAESSAVLSDNAAPATSGSSNNNALYGMNGQPSAVGIHAQVSNPLVTGGAGAGEEEVCSLCLGSQCDRIAVACGHRFHYNCLHDWGDKLVCPMCRPANYPITSLATTSNVSAAASSHGAAFSHNNNVIQLDGPVHPHQAAQPGASLQSMPQSKKTPSSRGLGENAASASTRPPPIDTTRPPESSMTGGTNKSPATSSTGVTPTRSGSTTSSGGGSGRARKNKKLKDCSVPGCDRTVRSRGLCKGHGGGRRCGFAGCGLSDQGGGYCISHGGGKRCQYDGCDNSAQSRGLCKLHGGGSRCTVANCTKSSQGRGLCRAHGGGRRCMVEGCNKTDRRAGYCVTHGADKKCIVGECSKTGRIDNMCTKHYFERNQPFARASGNSEQDTMPTDMGNESTMVMGSATSSAKGTRKKLSTSGSNVVASSVSSAAVRARMMTNERKDDMPEQKRAKQQGSGMHSRQ
uniref:RING-type domain-containing protein n=1 Tax=Globisporangium ultimum (strain ATCC 200006 / CBS 805.95 / DAOM BR144) TaxID=431595 RepID=K3WRR5_GLOUD